MRRPTQSIPVRVGVNVRIPASLHRAMRIAMAAADRNWDEVAAEAFDAWAKAHSGKR
jgi:hypothetical protein